jgi:hypothetical protein
VHYLEQYFADEVFGSTPFGTLFKHKGNIKHGASFFVKIRLVLVLVGVLTRQPFCKSVLSPRLLPLIKQERRE